MATKKKTAVNAPTDKLIDRVIEGPLGSVGRIVGRARNVADLVDVEVTHSGPKAHHKSGDRVLWSIPPYLLNVK